MVERIARDTAIACVTIAVLFAMWQRSVAAGLAVLGGGALIAISFWAIRGAVDAVISATAGDASRPGSGGANSEKTGRKTAAFTLVKFFTRH
ncbi:MAG TPA: hypothetical protein VEA16_04940, partial [Vicinamibacterales bacterium]|nr:hypothetical protein [Vicinamibacterales bacterium]